MTRGVTDYDAIASAYDVERSAWAVPRDDVIDDLDPARAITVLDLGCGTGTYLATQMDHFSDRPIWWLGVDPSTAMLREAGSKVGRRRLARGRGEDIPLRDESVDYVFSGWVFHHVADKERALAEVARILKPHGRLRLKNIDPWANRDWWVYDFFPGTWNADEQRFWPAERLSSALERYGFEVSVEHE